MRDKSSSTNLLPRCRPHQKKWLTDLSKSVQKNGGLGVIYWEPAWVSSACSTQWGKGAHYENASFFDFDNHLILDGGIGWMQSETVSTKEVLKQIKTTPAIKLKNN